MKQISILTFLLVSLTATAQFGIHAGVNTSWFNRGDKTYRGIEHNYQSITAGFYHKSKHLQVELLFTQGGAKNPKEDNRTFKTYSLVLPVTYIVNAGDVNFQIGGYVSKLVGATRSDFFSPGENFGWAVGRNKWPWYHAVDYGPSAGIGVNLHPLYLEAHYRQGLSNVRQYDLDHNGTYDPRYQGCRNASFQIGLYVPFNLNK